MSPHLSSRSSIADAFASLSTSLELPIYRLACIPDLPCRAVPVAPQSLGTATEIDCVGAKLTSPLISVSKPLWVVNQLRIASRPTRHAERSLSTANHPTPKKPDSLTEPSIYPEVIFSRPKSAMAERAEISAPMAWRFPSSPAERRGGPPKLESSAESTACSETCFSSFRETAVEGTTRPVAVLVTRHLSPATYQFPVVT